MPQDPLDLPTSDACRAAHAVAVDYCSAALHHHSLRSYLWGAEVARQQGIAFDEELLFVAAMLHDLGLTPHFDNATDSFEVAGGHLARVFAAGAGWSPERGLRAAQVVERHMWAEVDPADDPEGHLLEVGTGIDISGSRVELVRAEVRDQVLLRWPRLGLAEEFAAAFRDQARR